MSAPLDHHANHGSTNYDEKPLEHHETHGSTNYDEKPGAVHTDQVEDSPVKGRAARGGAGSKIKRHCARFWWLHLIIFCVIFLIIALCLVYVGMPKIAQKGVDDSSLEVTQIQFLNPTSDSLVVTQEAILHSPSKYTPTLDAFDAGSYLIVNGTWAAEPMVFLPMPKLHALHPSSIAKIESKEVQINNLDRVTDYAIAVLTQEEVTNGLAGKTKLHLGKLPVVNVHYNTTTTYKGLNKLAGFNVTDVRINITETRTGVPNLKGNAFVPNPSPLTIEMGNVTLILSTEKEGVVGNSTILNFTLKPGDNSLPMTGIIEQPKVIDSMVNGIVELLIVGNSSVYNGQHLTYYEKALASNKLSLKMNVQQVLSDSLGLPPSK